MRCGMVWKATPAAHAPAMLPVTRHANAYMPTPAKTHWISMLAL